MQTFPSRVPHSYGRYIEPFFGGGALYFALQPEKGVIADSNPELINVYQQIAANLDEVIDRLSQYENETELFYAVRGQDPAQMTRAEAAARMIFLNKTCFNGFYRVNKKGSLMFLRILKSDGLFINTLYTNKTLSQFSHTAFGYKRFTSDQLVKAGEDAGFAVRLEPILEGAAYCISYQKSD